MAYAERYRFNFRSINGKDVVIRISEDGYEGSVTARHIGGAPSLRLEQNGNIKGMSLEIPAECVVEDEYASLYTSNPYRFLVELVINNSIVWRGFITPELYAAPWVDPPYDVTLTATDGLGELKMHNYPALGRQSLEALFATLLGATGLTLPVKAISTVRNDLTSAMYMLGETSVNLDDMAGESYYDVLDKLLGSLHATIQQAPGEWLIIRETDVEALDHDGTVEDTSGMGYPIISFGTMKTNPVWPVGRLSMEIVPAKNSVKVSAPNKFPESILSDPEMTQGLWLGEGTHYTTDDGFYALDYGKLIYQDFTPVDAGQSDYPDLQVKVKARQSGYKNTGYLRLGVEVTGTDMETGLAVVYYWGTLREQQTSQQATRSYQGWAKEFKTGELNYVDIEIPTARNGNATDCQEETIDIPLASLRASYMSAITRIRFYLQAGTSTIYVHHASVAATSVIEGINTRLVLDNAARGAAPDVETAFADSYEGNHALPFMTNSVYVTNMGTRYKVSSWASDAIPLLPYGEWLAKDYALSCAMPRLRLQGKLNIPAIYDLPALFYETGGLNYITETWSFDILNDEADVVLVSLPAAAIQVVSVRQTAYGEDGYEVDSSVSVFPASFTLASDDTTTRCYMAVTAPASMAWTVTNVPSWITMSETSGTGSGTISFIGSVNSGSERRAVILVAGIPVSIVQEGIGTEFPLTIQVTPSDATIALTIDGVAAAYTDGMLVASGSTVGVTVSKEGVGTVTDSFTMPASATTKAYTVAQDINATISFPKEISSAAQAVRMTVSDPSNHGWLLDFGEANRLGFVTGGAVVSGSATAGSTSIEGTGDAIVTVSVTRNSSTSERDIGTDPASIRFYDLTRGYSYYTETWFTQLGTSSSSVPVTSITLNKTALSLNAGNSEKLIATVLPANATNPYLTWSSSNTSVASVGQDGTVYANAAGTCTITAAATDGSGKTATCTVTVTGSYVRVTDVTLDRSTVDVAAGDTVQLTATVLPSNATNKSVTWGSSDTSIATVSQTGLVTGVAPGQTVVYVRTADGDHMITCTVNVTSQGYITVGDITVKSVVTSASARMSTNNMVASSLTASCAAAWVDAVSVDTSGSPYYVRLALQRNTATTARSAQVTVSGRDTDGNTVTTTFTITQNGKTPSDLPCEEMEILGPDALANSNNEATYTAGYLPDGCTQDRCVWSLSDPDGMVELTDNGDGTCTLEVVDTTANNHAVTLTCRNYYNGNVFATKTVTASYVGQSSAIVVSTGSVTVNADSQGDSTPILSLASGVDRSALVVTHTGFISTANVNTQLHVVTSYPKNTGTTPLTGKVVITYTDPTTGVISRVEITYTQAKPASTHVGISAGGMKISQSSGTVTAIIQIILRNRETAAYTFKGLGYTLVGLDANEGTVFTKTGTWPEREVAAMGTEVATYTETWSGSLGAATHYQLTVRNGTAISDTITTDGNDDIVI